MKVTKSLGFLFGLLQAAAAASGGLNVYYDMSKAQPTTHRVPDQSGHGLDGEWFGGQVLAGDGPGGVGLDGNGSYIQVSDKAKISPNEGGFSLWVRFPERPGEISLLVFNGPYLQAGLTDKYVYFQGMEKGKAAMTGTYVDRSGVIDGKWHQIAGGYGRRGLWLYVDGELVSGKEVPHLVLQKCTGHTAVGTYDWDGRKVFMKGRVGSVKIYDRLPTAREIRADYDRLVQRAGPEKVGGSARVTPAINAVETGEKPGKRNWELDLAGRTKPDYPALEEFEDLSGWTVVCKGGVEATVRRSVARKVFSATVVKLTYTRGGPGRTVEITPPKPLPIPGRFTAVDLWAGADHWGFDAPPPASCTIIVEDSAGNTHEVWLREIDNRGLTLFHGAFLIPPFTYGSLGQPTYRTNRGDGKPIMFPAYFKGLKFSTIAGDEPRTVYFDCLSFYTEDRPALKLPVIPDPSPIPVSADTILPDCLERVDTAVTSSDRGVVFRSTFGNHTLEYIYRPSTGTLSDLTISYNGKHFQPCAEGGIGIERDGALIDVRDLSKHTKLSSFAIEGKKATAVWEWRMGGRRGRIEYVFAVKNKSLIIDVSVPGGHAERVVLGKAAGLAHPKAYLIPYLNIPAIDPSYLAGPAIVSDGEVFFSGFLDPYSSHASALFTLDTGIDGSKNVVYNGGAVYEYLSDGTRNDVTERIVLTASNAAEEVLPNIPNPPAMHRSTAADYFYTMFPWPFPKVFQTYRKYGLEKLNVHMHGFWSMSLDDVFTTSMLPVPNMRQGLDPDGLTSLRKYKKILYDLGYKFGVLVDFCNISGPSRVWDRNALVVLPNGDWSKAWPSSYGMKPVYGYLQEREVAARLSRDVGLDSTYMDEMSSPPPWGYEDYDARLRGAGQFRTTHEMYARILRNEQKTHGMTWSEGLQCGQWFYAGLVNGSYGDLYKRKSGYDVAAEPLVPAFELRKVHPLSTNIMMGPEAGPYLGRDRLSRNMAQRDKRPPFRQDEFNQLIAATLGYGHVGLLADGDVDAYFGTDGAFKLYFLLSEIQKIYGDDVVETINYFDGTKFVDTSRALISDCYKDGRLYLKYRKGLEIYINFNKSSPWAVSVGGQSYTLPAFGYAARYGDQLRVCSVMAGPSRLEYSRSARYIYADSHRGTAEFEDIKIDGAGVLLMAPARKEATFIPMGNLKMDLYAGKVTGPADRGCPLFGLSLAYIRKNLGPGGPPRVWGCDEDGKVLGAVPAAEENGYLVIRPSNGYAKYKYVGRQ